ncbi:protein kilB [Streptomyces cinereoruber]|uniref:protein kilB n=1 Tax=Streptomyces cinereoruber TaxID=67260 RepID=UPI003C2DEA3A
MWASLIAVLGTLAGAIVAGVMQQRMTRTALREARADERRRDAVQAITDLTVAIAAHRKAMWLREDLRLRGQDWTEARTASHATRDAVTAPQTAVRILTPELAAAADDAVRATYALRGAADAETLAALREDALAAAEDFTAAAGRALAA